jgi:hypothetical protein
MPSYLALFVEGVRHECRNPLLKNPYRNEAWLYKMNGKE